MEPARRWRRRNPATLPARTVTMVSEPLADKLSEAGDGPGGGFRHEESNRGSRARIKSLPEIKSDSRSSVGDSCNFFKNRRAYQIQEAGFKNQEAGFQLSCVDRRANGDLEAGVDGISPKNRSIDLRFQEIEERMALRLQDLEEQIDRKLKSFEARWDQKNNMLIELIKRLYPASSTQAEGEIDLHQARSTRNHQGIGGKLLLAHSPLTRSKSQSNAIECQWDRDEYDVFDELSKREECSPIWDGYDEVEDEFCDEDVEEVGIDDGVRLDAEEKWINTEKVVAYGVVVQATVSNMQELSKLDNAPHSFCKSPAVDVADPFEEEFLMSLMRPEISERELAFVNLIQIISTNRDRGISLYTPRIMAAIIPVMQNPGHGRVKIFAAATVMAFSQLPANGTKMIQFGAVPPLVNVLANGSLQARANAATAIYNLSVDKRNMLAIGALGAIPPLLEKFLDHSVVGRKAAAQALYQLTLHCPDNLAILANMEDVVSKLLTVAADKTGGNSDKAIAVRKHALMLLCNLAEASKGRKDLIDAGAVELMVRMLREGGGGLDKYCLAVMYRICMTCSTMSKSLAKASGAVVVLSVEKEESGSAETYLGESVSNARTIKDSTDVALEQDPSSYQAVKREKTVWIFDPGGYKVGKEVGTTLTLITQMEESHGGELINNLSSEDPIMYVDWMNFHFRITIKLFEILTMTDIHFCNVFMRKLKVWKDGKVIEVNMSPIEHLMVKHFPEYSPSSVTDERDIGHISIHLTEVGAPCQLHVIQRWTWACTKIEGAFDKSIFDLEDKVDFEGRVLIQSNLLHPPLTSFRWISSWILNEDRGIKRRWGVRLMGVGCGSGREQYPFKILT